MAVKDRGEPWSRTCLLLGSSSTPPASRRPRWSGLAAELKLDPGDQFPHEEWLHNVVVRADLQTHDPVRFGGPRRQEDNRDGGQIGIFANSLADIQPVGIRQHDVEQDEIGPHLPAEFDGALASLLPGQRDSLPSRGYTSSSEKRSESSSMSSIFFMFTTRLVARLLPDR